MWMRAQGDRKLEGLAEEKRINRDFRSKSNLVPRLIVHLTNFLFLGLTMEEDLAYGFIGVSSDHIYP